MKSAFPAKNSSYGTDAQKLPTRICDPHCHEHLFHNAGGISTRNIARDLDNYNRQEEGHVYFEGFC